MSRFFDMDSPLFQALGRLADFMILNIIFIVTCIPIFTIGASCTAMSYMTLKFVRNEESYIVKGYFKAFKENFKQSTLIWIVCLIVSFIFYMDFNIVKQIDGTMGKVMLVSLSAISLFLFMVYIYIFPVLSRFYNSIRNTVRNAFIMAILNFPITLLLVIIDIAVIALTILNDTTFVWGLLIWLMVGFSFVSYVNSKFLNKIFDKYIPEDSKENISDEFITGEDVEYEMSAFKNLQPTKVKKDE